jgi:arylsulfatase A-like enzyme
MTDTEYQLLNVVDCPMDENVKRPNVVFIFADEWRAQATGYNGDPNCSTPNLDTFSNESLDLTEAVSGCSVCCPYRGSLLTGQYPLSHGIIINDVELDPNCTSIADAFNNGGYDTAYIGKWHVYGSPQGNRERREKFVPREYQLRFDYWKGFECNHDYNDSWYFCNDDPTPRKWVGYDAFAQSRDAARYIRDQADKENPFLLMLSWGPPHFPLNTAPDKYRRRYSNQDLELHPNVPANLFGKATEEMRGYYSHVDAIDDALAIVLEAVQESGIAQDTIFVVTSDHGDMRQSQGLDTKLFPFEESVRVPFLLRWPRLHGNAPRKLPVPLNTPDIMPTLLGLCHLEIPVSVEGQDWSPILRGEDDLTGEEAALLNMPCEFTELIRNGMRAYRGIRTAHHTYVRNVEGPWLLYDNIADPYQRMNLIGLPEHAELQAQSEQHLCELLDAIGDEFLDSQTYLERSGLSHYQEALNVETLRTWSDPWA